MEALQTMTDPMPAKGGRLCVPLTVLWREYQPTILDFRMGRLRLDNVCAKATGGWPDDALVQNIGAYIAAPERRMPLSDDEEDHCVSLRQILRMAADAGDANAYSWAFTRALLYLTPPQIIQPQPELLQAWTANVIATAIPWNVFVSIGDDAATTRAAMDWCINFARSMLQAKAENRLCGGANAWPYWLHVLGHNMPVNIFYSTNCGLKDYVALFGRIRAEAYAAVPPVPVSEPVKLIGVIPPKNAADRRPRVGLLCHSPYGHGHGLPHLLWWLACMDRERFQPVLILQYHTAAPWEEILQRYPSLQDYAPIVIVTDAALPQLAQFDLDLLYYFQDICKAYNEQPAYLRLARKQLTGFYTPATTGAAAMDYFVTAPELETRIEGEFTEQVILTPGLPFCFHDESYLGITPKRDWRDADIPADATVYVIGSSMLAKLRPEFIDTLLEILRRTPGSYCVGMPMNPAREGVHIIEVLFRKAQQAGIDPDRIRLTTVADRALYHGLIASSDVFLDYFPFSGTNNLCDPIALERPCITLCPPGYSRNRIGGAILRTLGLSDLVVETTDAYIELAVTLGKDPFLRRSYRQRMGRKILENSPLCDGMAFMDRMQKVFVEALGDSPVTMPPRKTDPALREKLDRQFGDFSRRPCALPEAAFTHDFVLAPWDQALKS